MKKRRAFLTSGKLPVASACPNCSHVISGVTGARLDNPFPRTGPTRRISIVGTSTMCVYCGALLIFADEAGRVRLPTTEERAQKLDPILQDLLDSFRRERIQPPNFTRKNYN
jgi:hypothetical protein